MDNLDATIKQISREYMTLSVKARFNKECVKDFVDWYNSIISNGGVIYNIKIDEKTLEDTKSTILELFKQHKVSYTLAE